MNLPIGSFDNFIRSTGLEAELVSRSGSMNSLEEYRFPLRGFLQRESASDVQVSGELISVSSLRFHVPYEECQLVGMSRAPRVGDLIELQGRSYLVVAVHDVWYQGQVVRYVLELREDRV